MNIQNKRIRQQACGDTDRNYSDVCLDYYILRLSNGFWKEYYGVEYETIR
jgi:hypothetical protein